MPRTVEKELWSFDELSDAAKEHAREWFRSGNLDYDWWECVYEDAESIGEILGIEFDRKRGGKQPTIWFSGFCSQGDGACFEGRYSYAKRAAKNIRQHAPKDTDLHRIADDLQELQWKHFYRLEARTAQRGHYYHSGCMAVDVSDKETGNGVNYDTEEALRDILRSFADWIYKRLEEEYNYLQSDEQVDESIRANEYEFDEDGCRV
jgi:hypothetical protein